MIQKVVATVICLLMTHIIIAQEYDPSRIQQLENNLEAISTEVPGLSEKLDITMQSASLSTFLLAISEVHSVNIDVSPTLKQIQIINNFKGVPVFDVIVYLSKTYNLSVDFTGTIIFFKPAEEKVIEKKVREIPFSYDPARQTLSIDLQNDNLATVFKLISNRADKGVFYTPDLKDKSLSVFIKDLPFDIAMEKLAYSNNLIVSKSKDGSFEFENATVQSSQGSNTGTTVSTTRRAKPRRSNFAFDVIDQKTKKLTVDIQNIAVSDIIYDIGNALNLDIFTASPLEDAGAATVNAKDITFDELLVKIFENTTVIGSTNIVASNASTGTSRPGQNGRAGATNTANGSSKRFTFKKDNNVYYFGTIDQLTVRSSEIIPLRFRSIEILSDPQQSSRSAGRSNTSFGINNGFNNNINNGGFNNTGTTNRQNTTPQRQSGQNNDVSDISELIPADIKQDLNIITDKELNSFIVSGASTDIERFKVFVKKIDKQVPIVIVEVMILEVNRNSTLDAGIEWGIGTEPTTTQGTIFPSTGLALGAATVNRILGRIDGSSFFNIGQVGPNFFATIRASEQNGNFKIKSSPRITTLNGHRAYFSNGRTSYFEVTQNQLVGLQNPVVSESSNFVPIDAELSLEVLPFVSADGEVTMDIKVIQSSFSGERITETGPPEISSREFTSIIKSRTNDIVVLGGLEEDSTNNSGTGVPFLSKIPIIKWFFSSRVRSASKSKLTVLIKPTVIY